MLSLISALSVYNGILIGWYIPFTIGTKSDLPTNIIAKKKRKIRTKDFVTFLRSTHPTYVVV